MYNQDLIITASKRVSNFKIRSSNKYQALAYKQPPVNMDPKDESKIWDRVEEFTRSMDQKAEREVKEIRERAYDFNLCHNLPVGMRRPKTS